MNPTIVNIILVPNTKKSRGKILAGLIIAGGLLYSNYVQSCKIEQLQKEIKELKDAKE